MDLAELQRDILPSLEKVMKTFIHLWARSLLSCMLLLSFGITSPKLGLQRWNTVVENPGSCDIVLAKTGKKLKVKWAMFHHGSNDPFARRCGGIPFWGWGFSSGKQFKDKSFTTAF
ncbi:MAG: hypothetical protein QXH37_03615 [Candidatus Bathyarchaeia archaeon]